MFECFLGDWGGLWGLQLKVLRPLSTLLSVPLAVIVCVAAILPCT